MLKSPARKEEYKMEYGIMLPEGRIRELKKLSHEFAKVSAGKPVGYETVKFLVDQCRQDPVRLGRELESRGLKALLLTGTACSMSSGALYAYHDAALSLMLRERSAVLAAKSWPVTAEAFVRRIAIDWAEEKTPLFDLIADTFNNKTHPGRTDVPVPDEHESWNPIYLAFLRQKAQKHNPV